ncbi:uncharacterized protein LOC135218553 [Macrobrachium nipponense]|uniref:uncharacterized protein LOC135218553 n=1 Tax=Macrobrachium nipponense TaxID=159736 RepID=UPI0030C81C12
MKVVAVLCLLGLVAAEPQLIMPYSTPLLTPTIKAEGDMISTYTATYPYAGIPLIKAALPGTPLLKAGLPSTPLVQAGLPLIHGYHPFSIPTVVAAKPAEEMPARQKRSADPSTISAMTTPAATIPATLATIPTTLNYAGLSAAVSPYTIPQTIPYAGAAGVTPFVGTWPFTTGLSPYTTHMPYLYPVVSSAKIETPKGEAVSRAKRSADPEADPQLLTTNTGVTGFAYSAVNTGTLAPTTYTYQNLPITYPTTYTSGYPFTMPLFG